MREGGLRERLRWRHDFQAFVHMFRQHNEARLQLVLEVARSLLAPCSLERVLDAAGCGGTTQTTSNSPLLLHLSAPTGSGQDHLFMGPPMPQANSPAASMAE